MKSKVISITFLLLLLASVGLLIYGNDGTNNENRTAATMPPINAQTVFSGEFASGTEGYINDRIGFRNDMIDISKQISSLKGIPSPDGKIVRANMDIGTGAKQGSDILVVNNKIMEMFSKKANYADEYAAAINSYAKKLDENIKLYAMLVPTQLEFEDPIYSNLEDSQKDAIDEIYSKLDKRVETVNVYDTLKSHMGEYIYFRTDHHWTMLGAYYGYKKFCIQTNQAYVEIEDFEKNEIEDFIGYLYAFANSPEISNYPDTIEWYDVNKEKNISWHMTSFRNGKPHSYKSVLYDKQKKDYDFFLGSDHPLACYTNSLLPDGKTIMIICDSYANVLAPWLMNNYKNVILINPRSYEQNLEVSLEKYKPDEVMILNYIFSTSFKDYCNILTNLY